MLYSISFFGSLAVVESVNSAYKIACYTADTLKSCVVAVIASSALGAYVTDYTRVSAAGISIYGVVYRAVADTRFLHASDNLLKCLKVLKRVAVKLYIADMTCVCECVIRRFQLDFSECVDGEVNRYME